MNRRTFLGAAAAATGATAGCSQLSRTVDRATEGSRVEDLAGGSEHPWDGEPVVVAVGYEDGTERENFPALVEEATTFWEDNAGEYAGFDVEYRLRPDAGDPDVRIVLVETVTSCTRHEDGYEVVGCAPLITGEAPDTARVEIKAGYSDDLLVTTIKHELGHTLGLAHDDEPAEIMSGDPADRLPNYETRRAIHEAYVSGGGSAREAGDHRREGRSHWEGERWSSAEDAYSIAAEGYGSAVESFTKALEDAESLGFPEAVDICRTALNFSVELEGVATEMRDAADARDDGNIVEANEHVRAANDHSERASEYEIQPSNDLAVALGLQ